MKANTLWNGLDKLFHINVIKPSDINHIIILVFLNYKAEL